MATESDWKNYEWQQRNTVRDVRKLPEYFPNVDAGFFGRLHEASADRLKFQMTPYMLSQIPREITTEDLQKHPWALQFLPQGEINTEGHDAYGVKDNWEKPKKEFPTSLLQHKYTNRGALRLSNCLAYCMNCFEAGRVLEKNPEKAKTNNWSEWDRTLKYISEHSEIEEIVLSGGDPLLLPDDRLDSILRDLSSLKNIRFKRIHTRALTHNPFRITDGLVKIMKDYRINEIAFDVAHSSEITPEFVDAVGRIREGAGRYSPFMVLHTPLMRGVNDSSEKLWDLFGEAYENNIKPYYLLHPMPHTPFVDKQRISVRDGVRLMKEFGRHKSHIAMPEYVIVHDDGKQTVPLELEGTPEFKYERDEDGNPIVEFLNWQDKWVKYPDTEDKLT